MTSLRSFRPIDLLKTSLTNLDPLTENYDISFYMQYLAVWPDLFTAAVDREDNIIGYMMGKVEQDPEFLRISENYLPWHGHVTALTIAPQYRRLGIAKTLTAALERGCGNQNAWFVDLFVRAGNATALQMYKGMGYSVFKRVVSYYSDDPTGSKVGEDAFDMRKPLKRDRDRIYVRQNGEAFKVHPEDIYHG